MNVLKEGLQIPVTDMHISLSGHDDKDNPICDAVVGYLEKAHCGDRFSASFCFMDEKVSVFRKGSGNRFTDFYTTTLLEEWLRVYFDGKVVNPFTLKIFHQYDDTGQIEDERLWIGIAEDNVDFDKLNGMERRLTRAHIDNSVRGDCRHCSVAMVLSEMFPNYEVNVDGNLAIIHTRGTEHVALNISERLGHWIDAYDNENAVGTFTLIIRSLGVATSDDDGQEYIKYLLDIKDLTK